MATMIPDRPHEFDPASQEGLMFEALTKLPDEYYVFHSFRITTVTDNVVHESEADFVIFNRKYGVLCLEAKAGAVRYENGYWYYSNGTAMHNGGPFNQASSNKWKLTKYIEKRGLSFLLPKCKFLHGVWFPSVTDIKLSQMAFPSEADKSLVLTREALENPLPYIERIYSIELPNQIQTELSEADEKRLVQEVLCPQFHVFPSVSFNDDLKKIVFHRLLKEQAALLDFLSEQQTAVINGAAGTGKTMIAVEKAKRHANHGEKVLFLCFNHKLKEFLSENYPCENVSYYTIPGLACKMCNTATPDYRKLKSLLEDMYLAESFPYKHVIVDEGQDFGMDDLEEANILQQIKDIISDTTDMQGSFYVFYDRLQLVQAGRMPKFIENADCKLTLYRNCRNTENIAVTSLRPLTDRKPMLREGCIVGVPAKIHFCEDDDSVKARLDIILDSLKADGYKDIVVLTCKTEDSSVLADFQSNGTYRKYTFTTCRKFKGLEADAVVLIDVEKGSFNSQNVLLYYVGASRARLKLEVVAKLTDEECGDLLENTFGINGHMRKPRKMLAAELNAIGSVAG